MKHLKMTNLKKDNSEKEQYGKFDNSDKEHLKSNKGQIYKRTHRKRTHLNKYNSEQEQSEKGLLRKEKIRKRTIL